MTFIRALSPITFYVFFPIGLLLFLLKKEIAVWGLDVNILHMGNLLLYAITALALSFHMRGIKNKNPHVFFRMVYGSMILRMFFCIIIVVIYAVIAGTALNKYSLLWCFVFYFLYSFLEVRRVFSLLKNNK
jgi:uncharacterized membrane protein